MRNPTNVFVLIFALFATLSLVIAAPIPTIQDGLAERSLDMIDAEELVARSSMNMVRLEERAPPKLRTVVTMMKGAQRVLKNSGLTHKDFGGKHPVDWHKDHVAQHIQNNPKMSNINKAAISAPAHTGGRGGGGFPVDNSPHITAKVSGPGQRQKSVHIPVPPGTPLVKPSDFH